MKKSILVLFVGISLFSYSQDTKKALFVGNIYTSSNNMPELAQMIASSLGDSLYWQMVAQNNATLTQHASSSQTSTQIEGDDWDFVILQENHVPLSLSGNAFQAETVVAADELCYDIRQANICSKPVIFDPWAQKNGDPDNCDEFPWVCSYATQQDTMTARCMQVAIANDAWLAPVGETWRDVLDLSGTIELYELNGAYPNLMGSYLAACVFYATLFGESPEGAWIPSELNENDAQFIQSITADVVLGEAENWNFNPVVWADLEFTQAGIFYTVLLEASAAVDSVIVDDGSGPETWFPGDNAAFTFGAGTHYFTLEVISPCGDVFLVDSLVIETSVGSIDLIPVSVFPNPVIDQLNFDYQRNAPGIISILDSRGRVVRREEKLLGKGRNEIGVSELPAGSYLLEILVGQEKLVCKFAKE